MSDLASLCIHARERGAKLLSIYLTAGYPDLSATVELARAIFDAGADFMELGIPFSDPIADGPVIQRAATAALAAGTKLDHVFAMAQAISALGPIVLMGYYNSVLGRGATSFLASARTAGVHGLILPDLLWDAEPEFHDLALQHGLPLIPFVAPTTGDERMRALNETQVPFVYAVSVTGVTGSRGTVPAEVSEYLLRVRSAVSQPVMVGFGVSNGDTARQLAEHADGVIVGSAIIRRIDESRTRGQAIPAVSALVRELKLAISRS
ncbi:tryptophan synthase subunit alpha [candidate division KSB1 bacterium]|nr:tryptophan synthase subunit alpha [candidate division KSB1 bacterium]